MLAVPVLFFEDSPLADSESLRESLAFPRSDKAGGMDYTFDWHSTFNASGKGGEHRLIRSVEAYRSAANFLRHELSGEAIIFTDLHMTPSDSTARFNLTPEDISDDLFAAASCFDIRVKSKANVLEYFNPERVGILLALNAAQNPNWRGILTFTSGRTDVDLNRLTGCVNTDDRIVWKDFKKSFSVALASTVLEKAAAINGVIDEFLEMRSGPPFWPPETDNWFESIDSMPPHPVPEPQPKIVQKIQEYLVQLLGGFLPPESWFHEPQWTALYGTLKGLIGASSASVSAKDNPKNLPLSAVPLLLGAQMAWNGKDIEWLKSYELDRKGVVEIMNHKNPVDAREAIRTMAVFLEHLGVGNNGTQVIGATWDQVPGDPARHLLIDFNIDPLSRLNGRGLLQTIFGSRWGNGEGQTVTAYVKMMEKARAETAPPLFSLCFYPIYLEGEGPFTRLDFRSLRG